ncbi:MAG: class I SAM-dependent methyltransferase [Nanoarchaeota archaeon]|nr:class I SAM-dependent methyltransferase [Nanoarchaeota archaeon]
MADCKICNGELETFLSLGNQPIANAFLREEDLDKPEFMFHLAAGFCGNCKMTQLVDTVPREALFNENYAYFSSVSRTMEVHFEKFARELTAEFLGKDHELVVELGCNDGIMLKYFDSEKIRLLGIEPSANVAAAAGEKGLDIMVEFFDSSFAQQIARSKGKAKIIYGANVTCHIEALHEVAEGVSALLDDKGVYVFEDPYLVDIMDQNAYDQIYDEHVWYFSVTSLQNFFKMHDLEIFDARRQPTHGGSMRYFVCKPGAHPIHEKVGLALANEKVRGLDSIEAYRGFAKNVERSRELLVAMVQGLEAQGKRITGYAASSKGTVVLNYCGIGPEHLDYISDSTPTKQGLFNPGMHIPIVSPDRFHEDPPDYALLLAWNYAEEIKKNEEATGVPFIVHIPFVRVI